MDFAKLIRVARCPIDGTRLVLAEKTVVQQQNRSIVAQQTRDRLDQKVTQEIEGGLVNESKTWLYPIRSGIPTLMADEAIPLVLP